MSEVIDNRSRRVEALKDIIQKLNAGEAPDTVKSRLKTIVRETDYLEIVDMEQQLIREGTTPIQIQGMCDLHSQVTREILAPPPARDLEPGHPADTFRRENEAIREVLTRMREAMGEVLSCGGRDFAQPLFRWRQALNDLMDIEKHYQRKEHLLFSCLERHGITGPSQVMWGKHDEIRAQLKSLQKALRTAWVGYGELALLAATSGPETAVAVEEMIYKEERILLPMSLNTLTEDEWVEIWKGSPEYGWCLVEPREGFRPAEAQSAAEMSAGAVRFPTGALNLEQLIGLFSTLPVDITFVDANDRVAFFSEGPDRVFARSKAVIGRLVQNCHPPKSVDTVNRILSDFREGRQTVAEFWINFMGRMVHIRYFAVKNTAGAYLGTLEVTQDISKIRALEGERRLLEYEGQAVA
jgi:uncharacterized protein